MMILIRMLWRALGCADAAMVDCTVTIMKMTYAKNAALKYARFWGQRYSQSGVEKRKQRLHGRPVPRLGTYCTRNRRCGRTQEHTPCTGCPRRPGSPSLSQPEVRKVSSNSTVRQYQGLTGIGHEACPHHKRRSFHRR